MPHSGFFAHSAFFGSVNTILQSINSYKLHFKPGEEPGLNDIVSNTQTLHGTAIFADQARGGAKGDLSGAAVLFQSHGVITRCVTLVV